MQKIILAIESSCDETAAAVMQGTQVLSHALTNQKIHTNYGGVVPEMAARAHQRNIIPTVIQALEKANITPSHLRAIAFTQGPGLMGPLLVGTSFAKGLACGLNLPLIPVHHIKAHILANFIELPRPTFPLLALVVSGGHTQLILAKDYLKMHLLGQTRDDAMGEAFDKIAKMMNLPYPGGVWIDKHATTGNPTKFSFPSTNMPKLDFSFSGIKTAFLYFIKKQLAKNPHFIDEHLNDLCASIQASLVDMVIKKMEAAIIQTKLDQIALGGGVAANTMLRAKLKQLAEKHGCTLFVPPVKYCTDNAAMIGIAAHYQMQAGYFYPTMVAPLPKMPL